MEQTNLQSAKTSVAKKILKWILISLGFSVFVIIALFYIGLKSINKEVQTNSPVKSVFDKQFLSEKEYEQKWNHTDDTIKTSVNNFNNGQYNFRGIEIKFIYPEHWDIEQRGSEISLTSQKINNASELTSFFEKNAIVTFFIADHAVNQTLEQYIKSVYLLDEKKSLPKEIKKSDLRTNCYKIINEKPQTEFYYKDYDGVKLNYYCENKNKTKYSVSLESSVPEKYIEVFEKIFLSVEVK